jgi:hypothetical protein
MRDLSLLLDLDSLFSELFSLLIRVGNCSISGCNTAGFCAKIVYEWLKIAEFPVKFPDNREFSWRLVRSALRRQPGNSAFTQAPEDIRE